MRASQVFRPGASVQRERSAGACNATFDLAGALAEGDAAGHEAAAAAGFATPGPRTAFTVSGVFAATGGVLGAPAHVVADRRAKAFVDFQNDVCVKDLGLAVQEGMRSIEHIKRYTTDRHGDRPGQALQHERAGDRGERAVEADSRGRPHHLSPALYAGDVRRFRRTGARRPVRSHPPDADPRLGRGAGRRVRGRGLVEAGLVFSSNRRNDARGGRARVPRDPRRRRPVRRLDPRQDRGRRPGRGGLSRTHVRQRLLETRGRPLPLRRGADRGRLRDGRRRHRAHGARPLPCDDDDRRRAARPRPYGGLSPD